MAETLAQSRPAMGRWISAPVDALRSMLHRGVTDEPVAAAEELLPGIDGAAEAGRRFAARVHGTEDSQPLANAASICRWELLMLRERVVEVPAASALRELHAAIIGHL